MKINFEGADLKEANFKMANLQMAQLSRAEFYQADFEEAILAHATVYGANLYESNFKSANLMGIELYGSDLTRANLEKANLIRASLIGANLEGANFKRANLCNADLTWANLTEVNFEGADLSGADLSGAILNKTNLKEAKLENTLLSGTILGDVNLDTLCGASLEYASPSYVSWHSVARSLRSPGLLKCLRSVGIPLVVATYLIDSLRSIDEMELFTMLQTVFLSYGGPDEQFAKKLRNVLKQNGVVTWFFPDDSIPGKRLHNTMREGVNSYDRMILVCSKSSLTRSGVRNEIQQALARESREGGSLILLPITIDGYLFRKNTKFAKENPGYRQEMLDRIVANFRDTDKDDAAFDKAVRRLLIALQKGS